MRDLGISPASLASHPSSVVGAVPLAELRLLRPDLPTLDSLWQFLFEAGPGGRPCPEALIPGARIAHSGPPLQGIRVASIGAWCPGFLSRFCLVLWEADLRSLVCPLTSVATKAISESQ